MPETSPNAVIPSTVKWVLTVLVSTAFVMVLNETTVAVALPSIMKDLGIGADLAQWFLTGFLLTMAIVLPTTGWILGRFTTRSVFFFATIIFLVGTIGAALAPNFVIMLLARVAQAIGTAIIMPLLMTVTMLMVPANRRGTIMGLIGVVMAAAPALGPTVAGLILSVTSWHGIFTIMVPLVAIATIIGAVKLTNASERTSEGIDVLSMILSVFAFGGLVYGLSSISVITAGGPEARTPVTILVIGIIGLALFVWRQIVRGKHGNALLDLRPLTNLNFTLCLLAMMGFFAALLGLMNTLPLFIQGGLMATALVTGLITLPGGILESALSPIAGRLFDRFGPKPLLIPGMLIAVISMFVLAAVSGNTSPWFIAVIFTAFAVGLAMIFTPVMTTALGSLPKQLYGHGSAIFNTMQQLAGAAGTALMISIYGSAQARALSSGLSEQGAHADGAGAAFITCGFVALGALIAAFFIRRVPTQERERERVELEEQTVS